jgi:hypothetical protein
MTDRTGRTTTADRQLTRFLRARGARVRRITTVRGMGYRLA